MATRRDPWQPIGTAIYHFVQFVANATGYSPLSGGAPMTHEHIEEPETRWMLCVACACSTVHISHFWVADGDTDWECDQCGAVTYG